MSHLALGNPWKLVKFTSFWGQGDVFVVAKKV